MKERPKVASNAMIDPQPPGLDDPGIRRHYIRRAEQRDPKTNRRISDAGTHHADQVLREYASTCKEQGKPLPDELEDYLKRHKSSPSLPKGRLPTGCRDEEMRIYYRELLDEKGYTQSEAIEMTIEMVTERYKMVLSDDTVRQIVTTRHPALRHIQELLDNPKSFNRMINHLLKHMRKTIERYKRLYKKRRR